MGISLGGQPCIEPNGILAFCTANNLPTDWYGKPNQFECPEGVVAGSGWVLLSRASLNALNLNAKLDLTFYLAGPEVHGLGSGQAYTVTLKNLIVVTCDAITSGQRGDPNECYLVELADRRRLLRPIPIDKAYNVLNSPGSTTYYSATLNSGVAWTWAQMVGDIWNTIGTANLGTFPGLPFTPDGTPTGFSFYGQYALDALGVVLDRLSCTLKLDPTTDTFSIVRIGATDATESTALTTRDPLRVWDADALDSNVARVPQYVRTLFPIQRANPDATGGSPWYHLDNADTTAGGVLPGTQTGTYAIVYDDLTAIYDSTNTLTNSAALTSRASERSSDYFRRARMTRLRRIYGLPLSDKGLLPGAQLKVTRWGDRGRGFVTEVVQAPGLPGPYMAPGGSGGSGGGGGGDWYNYYYFGGPTYNEQSIWNYYGGDTWIEGGPTYFLSWIYTNLQYLTQLLYYFLSSYSWVYVGPVVIQTLLEVCGNLFYCCYQVTAWTTDQNNWAQPANKVVFLVSAASTGNINLTGIVPAQQGGAAGPQYLILVNNSASTLHTITLKNQNAGSAAANRFSLPYGLDLTLDQNDVAVLWYDTCTTGQSAFPSWRLVATTRVYQMQGTAIQNFQQTPPSNGNVLTWVSADNQWEAKPPGSAAGGLYDLHYWKHVSSWWAAGHYDWTASQGHSYTGVQNTLIAIPFFVVRPTTLDQVSVYVDNTATGGKVRLGIYDTPSTTNLDPGGQAVLFDSGDLDGSTAGSKTAAIGGGGLSLVPQKLYWLCYNVNNVLVSVRGTLPSTGLQYTFGGWQNDATTSFLNRSITQAYGAMPATFPAGSAWTGSGNNYPLLFWHISAET